MDFGRSGCVFFLLFELKEEAGIAVAQESEIVGEGVIVDGAPVVIAHKGGDEEQQCALRLVEIGYHALYDAVGESRCYHQLSAAQVVGCMVPVKVVDYVL